MEQFINTSLFTLLSLDFYYYYFKSNNKISIKHDITTEKYIIEISNYARMFKSEIISFILIILTSGILASFYQMCEVNFLSKLYLGNANYYDVLKLIIVYLIDLYFDNYISKLNNWIIYPLKKGIKTNFLLKVSNSNIEKLDEISEHELKQALNKKIKAIIASPKGIKQLCRTFTWIIVNAITISTISYTWVFQIIISTYLFLKYICWNKLEKNKNLEKENSKLADVSAKSINHILQDIRSFHQFKNINKKIFHNEKLVELTNEMNKAQEKIDNSWKYYYKFMAIASKLNWFLIILQIINCKDIPKNKISVVLTACSYISWNFNAISNIITDTINDIASYQTYLDLLDKIYVKSSYKDIQLSFNDNNVIVNNIVLKKGFNQLTGVSGSGKTTFLKNLFFSQKNNWNNIAILYQNSRHQFENKTPKNAIIGYKEINLHLFRRVYNCIELYKDFDEELVKPSGGEIQKMRIGMTLYEAILLDVKLLILDEPDNNIDPVAFNKIMTNIGNEFNDIVILFTTHKGELLSFEANKISIREVNL